MIKIVSLIILFFFTSFFSIGQTAIENNCPEINQDTVDLPDYFHGYDSIYVNMKIDTLLEQVIQIRNSGKYFYMFAQSINNCNQYKWIGTQLSARKDSLSFYHDIQNAENLYSDKKQLSVKEQLTNKHSINYIIHFESTGKLNSFKFPNTITVYEFQRNQKWMLYAKLKIKSESDYLAFEQRCAFGAYIPQPSKEQLEKYNSDDWGE